MDRLVHLTTETEKRITEADRRLAILEFLKERQKAEQHTTKATVIRHLKERKLSSRETGLNLINLMIKEGKLDKKEINSQVHFLTINETDEFIKIDNILTEIENFMNRAKGPLEKLKKVFENPGQKREDDILIGEIIDCFITPSRLSLQVILEDMLIRIARANYSEVDRAILSTTVIRLLNKMATIHKIGQRQKLSDANGVLKEYISNMKENFEHARYIRSYAEEHNIDLHIMEDLITTIEKFRKFNT